MPRASSKIVHDYQYPTRGASQTLSLDNKIAVSVAENGFKRDPDARVSFHANPEIESHHFGMSHPMKPWRLTLANKIIFSYGMHHAMDIYNPRAATKQELGKFHTEDYINALQNTTPDNVNFETLAETHKQWNFGDDCPIFDGLFNYVSLYAGGTMDAARKLCNQQSDIAVNWSGGLHHAKKSEASGFCYINDIVLGIQELLLYHPRVLYIDIDVHHGDGVEQAFWSTNRVMTLSFHKYAEDRFFPGTGGMDDTGPKHITNPGAHHSLNVPLNDGVEDEQYIHLFKTVVDDCMLAYQPTAIVLQCGGDSLGGDRLGVFNLNIKAHGACAEHVKKYKVPLLVLGGGGYIPRNVSRLWAYETAIMIGSPDIHPNLPSHTPFLDCFGPDRSLFPPLSEWRRYNNQNSNNYIRELIQNIREQLRYIEGSPSVKMSYIPPNIDEWRKEAEREFQERKEDERRRKREEENAGNAMELHRD